MIQLNPQLETILDASEPNRLKALLMWFSADEQTPGTQSQRLQALMEEVETLDILTCYNLIRELEVKDMVNFAVQNEFGPQYADKASVRKLIQLVSERL